MKDSLENYIIILVFKKIYDIVKWLIFILENIFILFLENIKEIIINMVGLK